MEPSTEGQALARPSMAVAAVAEVVPEGQDTGVPPEQSIWVSACESISVSHKYIATSQLLCLLRILSRHSMHSPLDSPRGSDS